MALTTYELFNSVNYYYLTFVTKSTCAWLQMATYLICIICKLSL
jgi:hypothetical protein